MYELEVKIASSDYQCTRHAHESETPLAQRISEIFEALRLEVGIDLLSDVRINRMFMPLYAALMRSLAASNRRPSRWQYHERLLSQMSSENHQWRE
jgi:hypothetical protein